MTVRMLTKVNDGKLQQVRYWFLNDLYCFEGASSLI